MMMRAAMTVVHVANISATDAISMTAAIALAFAAEGNGGRIHNR